MQAPFGQLLGAVLGMDDPFVRHQLLRERHLFMAAQDGPDSGDTVGVSAYVSFIMFRVQRKLLASESPVDLIDSVKLAAQNLNRNAVLTFWALNAAVQVAQSISEASVLYWLLLLIVNAIAFYYIFLCEVKNLDPIAACKFSLRAVMFNILPMIVFCLSILLWSLASAFTLGMGLIILAPLCNLANLLMANQVFGGANITIVEDSTPAPSATSNQA